MTHPAEQSKAAFDAVWAQVSGPIMLSCRRLSRNAEDAQDLEAQPGEAERRTFLYCLVATATGENAPQDLLAELRD